MAMPGKVTQDINNQIKAKNPITYEDSTIMYCGMALYIYEILNINIEQKDRLRPKKCKNREWSGIQRPYQLILNRLK